MSSMPTEHQKYKACEKLASFLEENFPSICLIPTNEHKRPVEAFKGKSSEELWHEWYGDNGWFSYVCNQEGAGVSLLLRDDLIVIDCDDSAEAEEFEKFIPEFTKTPKQATKKGCHYFFKRGSICDENNIYCSIRPFENLSMDILTKRQDGKEAGMIAVYPSPNKQWVRSIFDTEILELPQSFVNFYKAKCKNPNSGNRKQDEPEDEAQEGEANAKNKIDFETLKEIVSNLSDKRADGYNDWTTTLWATYNIARANGYIKKGKNLIHAFSERSFKYNEDEVEEYIDNASNRDGGVGLGTLLMMLKEDNEIMFNKIQVQLKPIANVVLNGYNIIEDDEDLIDLRDGTKRDYDTMKHIFEATNFKVSGTQAKFIEIKKIDNSIDITERNRKDFLEEYENLITYVKDKKGEVKPDNFAKIWLKDPLIRTYDNIDFLPPPNKAPPKTFNTWKGLRASTIPLTIAKEERDALLKPMYEHMMIICNHNAQSFKFLKHWIADLIQRPGKLLGYAICFQSDEGTGKSTLIAEFLGKRIIGDLYYWESSDVVHDLFDKHSNAYHNRLLVNIDEPKPFDLRNNADRFKSLITNNRQKLENKNKDCKQINSFARYCITTNNEDVLKISSNDRRFTIIECSNEKIGDMDYFDFLYEYIDKPEVQRAFYDDMMEVELDGFNWRAERPITDAYIHNMESCIHPIVRFIAGKVLYCESCKVKEDIVLAKHLYSEFTKVLSQCGSTFKCEFIAFNNRLKKMTGIEKKKTKYGATLYIDITALKDYLEKKEKFDFNNFELYEIIDDVDKF